MNRHVRLLLVVALAGACGDQKAPPTVQGSFLPDSAEQMLFNIEFALTDGGIRRAQLRADTMLMYEENTRTELKRVNATFFTPEGTQDATLTSLAGTYNVRLGTMEARGNVVVVSTDGRKLQTQQLRFDPSRNEVTSDSAFVLTEAARVSEGVGFVADPDLNNIRILKVTRVSGQQVTIPKR
jgi:LPS export ABC transporter protein LptC